MRREAHLPDEEGPQETRVVETEATVAGRQEPDNGHDNVGRNASMLRLSKSQRRLKSRNRLRKRLYLAFAFGCPSALAESCVSLAGSTQCSAFNASSISTDSTLTGLFPFLSNVTDTTSFDTGIQEYIQDAYTVEKYQDLFGCSAVNASNTTDYYARYTTSVLCNAIIQNSITPCGLSGSATRPLCADTCAEFAESEEDITASTLCGTAGSDALTQIRADFTNCALPADSLSGTCIEGSTNQPDNCGFSTNLDGLCSYCAASSPNATDSCCVYSETTTRCVGVVLPFTTASSVQPLFPSSTASATPSGSTSAAASNTGHNPSLTGGQIAGIVVGSVLGAFLCLALLILGCILLRRRKRSSPANSVFNQPVQSRQGPPMAMHDGAGHGSTQSVQALPGGRVARMAALEGGDSSDDYIDAMMARGPGPKYTPISSEEDTPDRPHQGTSPPKRSGSLTSGSLLALGSPQDSSPEGLSSPEGTGQSEQLDFFKDYYSQDEIHVSDLVSTLWAYEPHAQDELQLERGDMVKVTGIWDDGWATGVRVGMKAEDWRDESKVMRDSGMSSSQTSPDPDSPIKAFPLVCVCLPQHWRKTIEGDTTEDMGSSNFGSSP